MFKLVAGQALEALWGQPSSEGLSITSMGGKPASCSCNALIFQIWILNFFYCCRNWHQKKVVVSRSLKILVLLFLLKPESSIIFSSLFWKKNMLTTIKLSSFSRSCVEILLPPFSLKSIVFYDCSFNLLNLVSLTFIK